MIDGPANEIARAFGELLVGRDFDESKVRAAMQSVEEQDWFWQKLHELVDQVAEGELGGRWPDEVGGDARPAGAQGTPEDRCECDPDSGNPGPCRWCWDRAHELAESGALVRDDMGREGKVTDAGTKNGLATVSFEPCYWAYLDNVTILESEVVS